ncbi:MAG: hypothetical protein LBU43_06680 [Candidatus Accumulibacter sp.]|nr:hypothetical protein [Accumulibacter sp.]
MSQLTNEQTSYIIHASLEAAARGDAAEESRLIRLLPLAPHLAKVAKEMWGKEYLLQEGYDLSEADAAFGADWLDR